MMTEEIDALYRKAVQHLTSEKFAEAVSLFSRVIQADAGHFDAYMGAGAAAAGLGLGQVSVAYFRRAAAMSKKNPNAMGNLARALNNVQEFEESEAILRKALKRDSSNVFLRTNLGWNLVHQNKLDEAKRVFSDLARHCSASTEIRMGLLKSTLLSGDLQSGFRLLADMHLNEPNSDLRRFREPFWDGAADVVGKTILLHDPEKAGYGDTIQMARFVPHLASMGAKVIIECKLAHFRLFEAMDGASEVVRRGETLPTFHYHSTFTLLPFSLGIDLSRLTSKVPYLPTGEMPRGIPPDLTAGFSAKRMLKVGLVWAGQPKRGQDARRSLELEELLPIFDNPNLLFYSVQVGDRAGDVEKFGCQGFVQRLDPYISDFMDTASLLNRLDLVISVDTSVAHLAGALGMPVWLLLPSAPDWRWLLDCDDSPWYPSMRLFRQPEPGDWQTVIERVRSELTRLANRHSKRWDHENSL